MTSLYTYPGGVSEHLDHEFLSGRAEAKLEKYRSPLDASDLEVAPDVELIEQLCGVAIERDFETVFEMDAWLGPRLHAALRLPRRVASDPAMWRWLAIDVMSPYVQKRWRKRAVTPMRYVSGDRLRNAASRLWWAAELTRNGPSYEMVPYVLANVRVGEFALELKYSWYRPAAIAFTRVALGLDGGEKLNDDTWQSLSVKVNAYLTLRSLEMAGLGSQQNDPDDEEWRRHVPSLEELTNETLPTGPKDGVVSDEAIRDLEEWFRELALEE